MGEVQVVPAIGAQHRVIELNVELAKPFDLAFGAAGRVKFLIHDIAANVALMHYLIAKENHRFAQFPKSRAQFLGEREGREGFGCRVARRFPE